MSIRKSVGGMINGKCVACFTAYVEDTETSLTTEWDDSVNDGEFEYLYVATDYIDTVLDATETEFRSRGYETVRTEWVTK